MMSRIGALLLLVAIPLMSATSLGSYNYIQFEENTPITFNQAALNDSDPGECLGEDFISCYENILEYVTLGEEAIKISDNKSAIIVIGLTRVGKSTFTQFVANESNPLVVVCEFTSCKIIDDSGDGSDSVISKTFVPNTVEDTITNGVLSPFYDMPGFDDTRNISVEIANSFFIQKVVKNIEKIKIVVVAKHAGFGGTETTFNNLMSFLIKFTKNPSKFRSSTVLISNFGDTRYDEAAHFGAIKNYLVRYNESLYGEESPISNPNEREIATNWIQSFLQAPEGIPDELQKVAVFYSPDGPNGTSIRDIPRFQDDLAGIKQLLWNETEFTPLSPDDVGFTLSLEADLFIERATGESSKNIRDAMTRFAGSTRTYLEGFIELIIAEPTQEKMERFLNSTNILQNLNFQDCNSSPDSSPRTCVHQIESQLSIIADEMNDLIFTGINKTTNFLEFAFAEVGKPKPYDMAEWTRGISGVWMEMEPNLKLIQADVARSVMNKLSAFAVEDTYSFFLNGFSNLISQPISDHLELFNQTIGELTQFEFSNCPKEPPNSPEACFQEIINKSTAIIEATQSNLKSELSGSVSFLQFASSKLNISTSLDVWVRDFISLKDKVAQGVRTSNLTDQIYTYVLNNLTEISLGVSSHLLSKTANFEDIQHLTEYLTNIHDEVTAMSNIFDEYNEGGPLGAYIELILTEFAKFSYIPFGGIRIDVVYMIERLEIFSWYSQLWTDFHKNNLVQPVFLESMISRFLKELYKDLQKVEIQIDEEGGLHEWRKENPNVNGTHFDNFWNKLQETGYIDAISNFNMYKEDIRLYIDTKDNFRNWLSILLDYTLLRAEACPVVASGFVVFENKYVSLDYIVDCLNGYSDKPTRVVALAENTFFFNTKFDSKDIQLPPNSKLFIMSPNVDATRAQEINLSGDAGAPPKSKPPPAVTPGQNGTPGEMGSVGHGASDLIGVYLTEKGSIQNVNIITKGGNGGQGQDGGDGASSSDTYGPGFGQGIGSWISKNQCSAWNEGNWEIQVRVHPNTCNGPAGGRCGSGEGLWVNICGPAPKFPGSGGSGGNGGFGSPGGFVVLVNVTTANATEKQGPDGETGTTGRHGNSGAMGKRGAIDAKIINYFHWDDLERRCWLEDHLRNTECLATNNLSNGSGNSSAPVSHINANSIILKHIENQDNVTNVGIASTYSLAEFKPFIDTFLSNVADTQNFFNRHEMSTFIDFVKQNSYLQGQ